MNDDDEKSQPSHEPERPDEAALSGSESGRGEWTDEGVANPLARTTAPVLGQSCGRCGSVEQPDKTGRCPVPSCRAFRVGNTVAVIHDGRTKLTAADFTARDALLDRLFAERGGRASLDIVSQLRIEDFATAVIQRGKVTKKLEQLGAVSNGAGRVRASIVATYKTFSERVERLGAELPPVVERSPSTANKYADMPLDDLVTTLRTLLDRALTLRDRKPVPEPEVYDTPAPAVEGDTAAVVAPTRIIPEHIRRVIEGNTPEEIARRSKEATDVMLKRIRYGHRGLLD